MHTHVQDILNGLIHVLHYFYGYYYYNSRCQKIRSVSGSRSKWQPGLEKTTAAEQMNSLRKGTAVIRAQAIFCDGNVFIKNFDFFRKCPFCIQKSI